MVSDDIFPDQTNDTSIWATGPEGTDKATLLALKALQDRPKFSIRMQIYLTVALSFVVFLAVATALLITTYLIEDKVRFLEVSNRYLFEIQQARRFEKNYFLYGTNLDDAIENVSNAKKVLVSNSDGLGQVLERGSLSLILNRLELYETALQKLKEADRAPFGDDHLQKKKEAEAEVRKQGQEMVSFAEHLMENEKTALDKMILMSRRVHIGSFVFLFFFFTFNTYFLGRRVLRPLARFLSYAERIAAGDYSPIQPARRYRDEFSNLAVAVNKMIREIEAKQEQLIQSHKVAAIGLLTSGVAHELNNPINNINLTAEYIIANYADLGDDEKKKLLEDIMRQGDRAGSTVRELLHFTRVKADGFDKIDIVEVIRDTLRLLENQLRLNKIGVQEEYPDEVPWLKGNRNNLQQVFLNLFTNAIQAMPAGGALRIVVADTHVGLLKIDVIDNGSGIKPEHLKRIFDPYFTTKSLNEGTGLGLSVCFGIIKKHGGKIMVSSEEGAGSTFSVYLPHLGQYQGHPAGLQAGDSTGQERT